MKGKHVNRRRGTGFEKRVRGFEGSRVRGKGKRIYPGPLDPWTPVFSYFVLLLLCAFVPYNLSGCGQQAQQEGGKQKVVGVSLLTRQHMFYKELEEGLREAAAKHNIKLLVQSGDFQLATQTPQIENFVVQKVDAIVVCPTDSAGIGAAIKEANKANIPVFTADIAAKEGDVVAHIASDNVAGGRKAGEYMAKVLGGKGKVIIIDHPEVTSVQDRVKGFKEALAKFPGIKIVAQPSAGGKRDAAMSVMENMLQAHPDLKGVFGINDDSALGALAAVKAANRKGIIVVGYDAIDEARAAILEGSALKADVIQYPKKIGQMTIETIVKHWNGEDVSGSIPVEVGIVDQKALKQK